MALATGLCLLVHGCESVNGGAVELSWKLRPASSPLEDKFVGCDPGVDEDRMRSVAGIRLEWEVRVQAEVQTGAKDWDCKDNHGVTGFDLPEGDALLTVKPLCRQGGAEPTSYIEADPASYIAPAAEQRRVIVGDTITLGAIELVVVVTTCDAMQPCICD
jgi:hypothetical protein